MTDPHPSDEAGDLVVPWVEVMLWALVQDDHVGPGGQLMDGLYKSHGHRQIVVGVHDDEHPLAGLHRIDPPLADLRPDAGDLLRGRGVFSDDLLGVRNQRLHP